MDLEVDYIVLEHQILFVIVLVSILCIFKIFLEYMLLVLYLLLSGMF